MYEGNTAPKTAAADDGVEAKITLDGDKDYGVVSMIKANLGEGVSATADGQTLSNGDLVDATENVTFTVSSDKAVVADKAGLGYGEAITAAASLTKGEVYEAYTKVTLANSVAKIKLPTDEFGNVPEITIGAAKVYGFESGSKFQVVGSTVKSMLVSAGAETGIKADAVDASDKISEIVAGEIGTASTPPTATIIVADRALSFAQES